MEVRSKPCCQDCGSPSPSSEGAKPGGCADKAPKLEGKWPSSKERHGFSFDRGYHKKLAAKGIGAAALTAGCCKACAAMRKGTAATSAPTGCCAACDLRNTALRGSVGALAGTWPATNHALGFSFDQRYHRKLQARGIGAKLVLTQAAPQPDATRTPEVSSSNRQAKLSTLQMMASKPTGAIAGLKSLSPVAPAAGRAAVSVDSKKRSSMAASDRVITEQASVKKVHSGWSLDSVLGQGVTAQYAQNLQNDRLQPATGFSDSKGKPLVLENANVAPTGSPFDSAGPFLVKSNHSGSPGGKFVDAAGAADSPYSSSKTNALPSWIHLQDPGKSGAGTFGPVVAQGSPSLFQLATSPSIDKSTASKALGQPDLSQVNLSKFGAGSAQGKPNPFGAGATQAIDKSAGTAGKLNLDRVNVAKNQTVASQRKPNFSNLQSINTPSAQNALGRLGLAQWSAPQPNVVAINNAAAQAAIRGSLGSGADRSVAAPGIVDKYADLQAIRAVIEPGLLQRLVDFARLEPDERPPNVGYYAWVDLAHERDVDSIALPNPDLVSAIIRLARAELSASPREVLDEALQSLQPAWDNVDPSVIDPTLVSLLWQADNDPSEPSASVVFEIAWARRAYYAPFPVAMPTLEMVAEVVRAKRQGVSRSDVVTVARGTLFYRLLGGSFTPQIASPGDTFIEKPLLEHIVAFARRLKPVDWWNQVEALGRASSYDPQTGHDSLHPPQGRRGRPPKVPEPDNSPFGQLKRKLQATLNDAADAIWGDVLAARAQEWEFPWPPVRLPDRQLLLSLICSTWLYEDRTVVHHARNRSTGVVEAVPDYPVDAVLASALLSLNRIEIPDAEAGDSDSSDGPLGKLQEPLLGVDDAAEGWALFWAVVKIGAAIIGSAIILWEVVRWCAFAGGGCYEFFRNDVFNGDDNAPGPPMGAPPDRPGTGPGGGDPGGGGTPNPLPKPNPTMKPGKMSDAPDNTFGILLPDKPPANVTRSASKTKPRDSELINAQAEDILVTERTFLDRLCVGLLAIGHGFQAKDLLLVMLSETGGTLSPSLGSRTGAMGMNQLEPSELAVVRPGMTRAEYTSLPREDQIEIVIDWFLHYMGGEYAGGTAVTRSAPAAWTTEQRAAVLYAINYKYPGSKNIDRMFSSSQFPSSFVLGNITPADIANNPGLDRRAPFGVMTLGDLEDVLKERQGTAPWAYWSQALSAVCE